MLSPASRSRGLRWLLVLLVVGVSLVPVVAQGSTTADVGLTAKGGIPAPASFSIVYVSDTEVELSWTDAGSAALTLVRAAVGRVPESRTDGYEVYEGSDEACTDTALDISQGQDVYYRAWSKNSGSVWSDPSSISTEDFMSASMLFIGLIILASVLTLLALKVNLILFRMAASLSWLSLGIWLLLSDSTNLQMSDTWTQVLGFVFIVMTIAPLTLQMVTEVRREEKGSFWSEWGRKPSGSNVPESRGAVVKRERREKLGDLRGRRQ